MKIFNLNVFADVPWFMTRGAWITVKLMVHDPRHVETIYSDGEFRRLLNSRYMTHDTWRQSTVMESFTSLR